MKRILLFFTVFLNYTLAFAVTPSDYLQQSLLSAEVSSKPITKVNIDCASLQLATESILITIPVKNVQPQVYFGDALGFDCISGGGCIQTGEKVGENKIVISKLYATGLTESVAKAFKLYQKSCGGPEKRPY
jgi:hypothetical protein